jgi:predicted O-linked N-acetylglucosamine transferase (SPINDLY family)
MTPLPDFETYYRHGISCREAGDYVSAVIAFNQALKIKPDFFDAYYALGLCFLETNNCDQANTCFRAALRLHPNDPGVVADLSLSLFAQGSLQEALEGYRAALALQAPPSGAIYSNYLLCLNYLPGLSPRQRFEEHKKFGEFYQEIAPKPIQLDALPDPGKKINIGYVSSNLCNHALARFLLPILKWTDRSRYAIFCYSNGARQDAMTDKLRSLSENWRMVHGMSDNNVANIIREDALDVLIDLSGHTGENRLGVFAKKPAPVQASYLGYPATTGLAAMDFYITDGTVDPPGQEALYTEKLARLENCFCCYEPDEASLPVNDAPIQSNGFVTFGSLHTLSRLNDEVIDLWSAVLSDIRCSRLFMARNTLTGSALTRISARFDKNGIDPKRIEMRRKPPTQGYLTWYHEIDISLDTFPWSGHTTACESLWMGVPVITLLGENHAGRMVAGILKAVGMDDWTAQSREEYRDLAVKAAGDIAGLVYLRRTVRDRMRKSGLCDGEKFVKSLERAYITMWKACCAST